MSNRKGTKAEIRVCDKKENMDKCERCEIREINKDMYEALKAAQNRELAVKKEKCLVCGKKTCFKGAVFCSIKCSRLHDNKKEFALRDAALAKAEGK
jgi:hypothetical protein